MTAPDSPRDPDAGSPPPDVTLDAPPEHAPVALAEAQASHVRADHVESSQSAIGQVVAHEVHSEQGAMGLVRARSVVSSEGAAGAIAASHVETHGGFAFLMVARRVSGDVTVLLDWRAAFAAVGALIVIGRLLRGRR
jgi:hypothetical protein